MKEVNKIPEYNLLHNIINPPKRAKNINIHYDPILHRCMNTRKGRARFKSFRILSNSGYISIIVMVSLLEKLNPDKYDVMQWNTQAENITTYPKVQIYFTLPVLSTINFVT